MIEEAPLFPVIKEIYDPSNERCNGIITPEAPIVITGHNLDMLYGGKYQSIPCSSVNITEC